MALDDAPGGERAVAAHADQAPLDERAAVVEDPTADPHAEQSPDDALEWRAVEYRDVGDRRDLPEPLVLPESRLVDRAELRPQRTEPGDRPVDQNEVDDGEQQVGHDRPRGVERAVNGGVVTQWQHRDEEDPGGV